jgi:hypothetical protein
MNAGNHFSAKTDLRNKLSASGRSQTIIVRTHSGEAQ